jgi:hypothetical protein
MVVGWLVVGGVSCSIICCMMRLRTGSLGGWQVAAGSWQVAGRWHYFGACDAFGAFGAFGAFVVDRIPHTTHTNIPT